MKSGGCTIQQALTPEAASILKQAVILARRRGHAQVTPLHLANTMLAASSGLLRSACLQSHSHPLQCRALELCFNVALNRLPTSTSGPMLGAHSYQPTISNSLVAAFKRAHAHQRRGSIENQQLPILAMKIEPEQLIISILDDPSVSRVMRGAGFSSTLVKGKVVQALSIEPTSQAQPPDNTKSSRNSSVKVVKQRVVDQVRTEDIAAVINGLINKKKRSSVIVGECISTLEGVVRGVMDKVEKGEVPECLRGVKFLPLSLYSFGNLNREEVDQKVGQLKCLVKGCLDDNNNNNNNGVILYLGDLKWITEFRASVADHQQRRNYSCPIEHMITELTRLVLGYGEDGKIWLMGIATFQTYMRCKSGHPCSLESIWGVHAITIPKDGLGLSLIPNSDLQTPLMSSKEAGSTPSWLLLEGGRRGQDNHHASSGDLSVKIDIEARNRQSSTCNSESTTSILPSWLQQYKDESKRLPNNNNIDQASVPVKDLCKKWSSSICNSAPGIRVPQFSERTLSFSSTPVFSYDQQYFTLHHSIQRSWPVPDTSYSWVSENVRKPKKATFTMSIQDLAKDQKQATSLLLPSSNPNSTPNSTSLGDVMEIEGDHSFKEYTPENFKALSNALEQKVSWQKGIISEIVNTVLECRSGKRSRKGNVKDREMKEETWLFFHGLDRDGKGKIARELATLAFGSERKFMSISLSNFSSSTKADSMEDSSNKRARDEQSCSYVERFAEAVSRDPHRVFFVEDIDQVDYSSQMGIKKAIERGIIINYNGEEISLNDAIIILSCDSFSSRSRACSPSKKQKTIEEEKEGNGPCVSLDLNISINDDKGEGDQAVDEIGLLASVDGCVLFKLQEP
ncbi:hypothetical protein Ancab_031516 [Ancistrocladus abbreviatus]